MHGILNTYTLKKHFVYLMIMLGSSQAMAQLPDGSSAPNFEVSDLDGQSHNLYAYLQEGYTVVVYFMATWSEPCWAYHNGALNGTSGQGALTVLHDTHGVANGGEVVVLMIEGDPNTNIACLTGGPGCNYTSYGNWSQDTPFPVIESSAVANQYGVNSYPTVITICPNGFITNTGTQTAESHWGFIETSTCPPLLENDAALYYPNAAAFSCLSEALVIDLVNMGTNELTTAHIISSGGMPAISYQWTGNLSTFQSASINLGLIAPNPGEQLLVSIAEPDQNSENDTINAGYLSVESTSHIRLELQSDTYPEDFSFQILDENNAVVVSDGNWGSLGADALIVNDYFLPQEGCYQVWFLDSYGDGLFEGAYCKVYGIDSQGAEMAPILEVGFSEFSEVFGGANVNQVVTGLGKGPTVFSSIEIFPNPSSGLLNLEFDLAAAGATKLELIDPSGKAVFSKLLGNLGSGSHKFQVDVGAVAPGFYLLSVTCDGNMISERIKLD